MQRDRAVFVERHVFGENNSEKHQSLQTHVFEHIKNNGTQTKQRSINLEAKTTNEHKHLVIIFHIFAFLLVFVGVSDYANTHATLLRLVVCGKE